MSTVRRGLTLVETLVAVVLSAFLANAVYQLVWMNRRAADRDLEVGAAAEAALLAERLRLELDNIIPDATSGLVSLNPDPDVGFIRWTMRNDKAPGGSEQVTYQARGPERAKKLFRTGYDGEREVEGVSLASFEPLAADAGQAIAVQIAFTVAARKRKDARADYVDRDYSFRVLRSVRRFSSVCVVVP